MGVLLQTRKTCCWIEALQRSGCRAFAVRMLLLLAFIAFTAAGAEARRGAPVPSKPALTAKKKRVLPVQSAKHDSAQKQHFSGFTLLGAGEKRELKSELEKHIGTRYKRGGTGRGGFDCSGFVRSMYQKLFGIELPHSAHSQFHLSGLAKMDKSSLQPGDLVFFAATAKKKKINHVGIYLDDGQFIHAQSKRGVVISNIDDHYWRTRLVSGKRLDNKKLQIARSFEEWPDTVRDVEGLHEEALSGLQFNCSLIEQNPDTREPAMFNSSSGPKQQFFEFTYVHPVFGAYGNLQVGSFYEHFDMYGDAATVALPADDPYDAYAAYSYSQGIRIASAIRPFQWLSITPFFVHYNHGHELDCFTMPERTIGLDVNLCSLDAGWSLSTGLRYASLSSASLRNARIGGPNLLDLSLTCSRRLSDRLQLAFMGQRLRSTTSDRADDAGSGFSIDQRLFFMLNFNY